MITTLNRSFYLNLIEEDLAYLRQQPDTLERRHIECLLEWIIRANGVSSVEPHGANQTEPPVFQPERKREQMRPGIDQA